jgi:Na+/phosphate symporter
LLAVGGILQFIQRRKVQLVGQIILSFGLLLFGIGYLKDSVEVLAATIDVAQYADMGRWVFYGGGIILALLLHSSGTTTIIAMTAMVGGIISFEQAIITMLGASIGSSLVTLYVSFG